jgi:hypothetical protein
MAKLSEVDARLLESLEAKYGTEELVTVIQSLTPSIAEVLPDEVEGPSPEEATLDFLRKLEGHCVRLQEIHWNTSKMNTHKTTDDMKNMLHYVIDSVAENMQGLLGVRIKIGSVNPIIPGYTIINDGYKAILNDILTFRASVDGIRGFEGVLGTLDNCINDLNKSVYLDSFE